MDIQKLSSIRTPYYLYDIELLEETLESIKESIKECDNYHVHYAIKANSNPLILKSIKKYGLGIDCVSGGEINACLSAGFSGDSIVFAGVGKSDSEILLGLDNDIFSFNVESQAELDVINSIASSVGKIANVCLRINPDVGAHTHTNITTGLAENKFGIAHSSMLEAILYTQSLKNIRFRGLHFHIGSQILDMSDFKSLCIRINEIQDTLDANHLRADIINVGGGLGIDYMNPNAHPIPNFNEYFSTFKKNLILRDNQELHFELGRSIVGQCGSLITKTLYIKETSVKKFVILDAGMTELIRPALYNAYHKIENLSKGFNVRLTDAITPSSLTATYDVVGPICESSDIFASDFTLPLTSRNDIIAIRSAGAYGESMSSTYNCRPLPKSYTLEELS